MQIKTDNNAENSDIQKRFESLCWCQSSPCISTAEDYFVIYILASSPHLRFFLLLKYYTFTKEKAIIQVAMKPRKYETMPYTSWVNIRTQSSSKMIRNEKPINFIYLLCFAITKDLTCNWCCGYNSIHIIQEISEHFGLLMMIIMMLVMMFTYGVW